MSSEKLNEQSYLLSSQYKSANNLKARIALHENYGTGKIDFHKWLFEHIDIKDNAVILELGTGSARVWVQNRDRIPQDWSITLSDFSKGMLAEAKKNLVNVKHDFSFKQIDIQDIPFSDNSFDMVMANHMLYHVPDIDKAIKEVKRVLKSKGKFYASTNGEGNMLETKQMLAKVAQILPPELVVNSFSSSFTLESAPDYLSKCFKTVKRFDLNSEIIVDKVEPIMAYLMSMTAVDKLEELMPIVEQEKAMKQLIEFIEDKLTSGPIKIRTKTGLLVAF